MKVTFYIIEEAKKWSFICHLIEKAYEAGRKVFIKTADEKETYYLDHLLWTFEQNAFIPHNLIGEGPDKPPPVQIGFENKAPAFLDLFINLSNEIPLFSKKAKEIIAFVPENPDLRALSREHFKQYRAWGAKIETHNQCLNEA